MPRFIDSINNDPTQKKNWKVTPRYETNERRTYLSALLNKTGCFLSSCICKSRRRQVCNRPGKINMGSVLSALLFSCPWINRALGPWQWLRGWAFRGKGHFFKHHLSNLVHCMMFLQLVGSFVFLQLWLFDCLLTIRSTWKSPLLVRMQPLSSNGQWPLALFWCRLKTFS